MVLKKKLRVVGHNHSCKQENNKNQINYILGGILE